MTIERENLIKAAVVLGFVFLLGCLVGFFAGKGMYQTHESIKIIRDTMVVNDTIVHYLPPPKDSVRTKFVTRYLPVVKTDTIFAENYAQETAEIMHDTIAVQVPIMSKHYNSPQYDIWISGYEASLDSAKVYQQTQYITEIREITKSVKQKRFGLGINAGYEYDFKDKKFKPCVGVGISYNLVTF